MKKQPPTIKQPILPNNPTQLSHSPPQIRKPLPQIYSYNRIPSPNPPHLPLRTEKYHVSVSNINHGYSRLSASNFRRYRSRATEHGQYITQECIPLLQERLNSIHECYQTMITEEKARSSERSEVIFEVMEEMQAIHNEKVAQIQRLILESEQHKNDAGFVDDKMNEIKGNIDQLIEQSNSLKLKNSELERKIEKKRAIVREKEKELEQISNEVLQARGELESFEITNLKSNRTNREILDLFASAASIAQPL